MNARVMRDRSRLDRVAVTLGAVSVLSAGFVVVRGDVQFVRLRGWGVAVALVLGVLAVAAGWTARRVLAAAAGAGFLVAAGLQVVLWAGGVNRLDGDGSTVSLWLGLGVGLLAAGLAPRIWPDEQAPAANR
jgi:hypothetical protein